MQKRKRKGEKKIMLEHTRKIKAKEAKNYTQGMRELKCLYTKKKLFKFRIEQSSTTEGHSEFQN